MELQKFLRNEPNALAKLTEEYYLEITRGRIHTSLLSFKYSQISSDFSIPMVCEARGCILNEAADWEIVARPLGKFFGHDDKRASAIDWNNCEVQEKLDGSCILFFYFRDAWRVATLGSPEASGPVGKENFTFTDLFWRVFREQKMDLPDIFEFGHLTFMFELTTPANRVVVPHLDSKLTLFAVRNNHTGLEYIPQGFSFPGWSHIPSFPLGTIEDCISSFSTMNPLKQEGYVVVDKDFNRIKIKHPGYVAMHLAKDRFTPKSFLDVMRSGENEEFLSALAAWPEFEREYMKVRKVYLALCEEAEEVYESIKEIPEQKDFALSATKFPYSGFLFSHRKGKVRSALEYFSKIHIDSLVSLVNFETSKGL